MKPYKSQYNEREFNRMAKRVNAYYVRKKNKALNKQVRSASCQIK